MLEQATVVLTAHVNSTQSYAAQAIKKPRLWRGKGGFEPGSISRRKGCKRDEQERCAEREQERRTGQLAGPGAAFSAVRFPVAASSEPSRLSWMWREPVGLGAAGC